MYSKQKGFTLIELVVVIVILGILAATALPKFVDLSKDARTGVMKGVEAAMRGADTMIYAKAAAAGRTNLVASAVTINSVSVATKYGYAGSITALRLVLDLNPASDFSATGNIYHTGATATASCIVTYTAAATTGGTPTYVTTSSGC